MPRPAIIAHRGASRERPENSLAAFERAIELGVEGIELDVHLHPDGILRVHHDPLPVEALDDRHPEAGHRAPAPPTLDEALTLIGSAGVTAYCELKGPGSAPGTVEALRRHAAAGAVHSFDHRMVAAARELAPEIPRGVLEVSYPVDHLHALASVAGRDLWRQWPFVDEDLLRVAHGAGVRVIAWTVNDPYLMRFLAQIGVDAICTDDPALAKQVLGA